MNSQSIFAGVDATGAICFVGDVPRGADCGCRCAACGAPLVAKRGDVLKWHFAHEASQERPDCYAGAVNLLRRIAIERLRQRAVFALPDYRETVTAPYPLPQLQDTVTWHAGEARAESWEPRYPQHAPVALLRLASGTAVHLYVEVESASTSLRPAPPHEGALLVSIPLPSSDEALNDLASAERHVDSAARFQWIRLPDASTAIAQASKRMEERARQLEELRRPPPAPPPRPAQVPHYSPPPEAAPTADLDQSPWAAWRKPLSAFTVYAFPDDSAWVLFDHSDGRRVMAPWPKLEDGWDEAMPARLGQPNLELGVYVLSDLIQATLYLNQRRPKFVRTASSWEELLAIQPA